MELSDLMSSEMSNNMQREVAIDHIVDYRVEVRHLRGLKLNNAVCMLRNLMNARETKAADVHHHAQSTVLCCWLFNTRKRTGGGYLK